MHYKKVKGILSQRNSMNIYRGCSHGCIYCDSRSICYDFKHDFEDIEIKENALDLLEQALHKKRNLCIIGTGSMSDPYMHIEEKVQYTRKSLEIIEKYGFGFTCITKSAKVLRDLDLLKSINHKAKCVIQMTLTTFDDELCKVLEPHVSTTKERFETLCTLRENGIPTVVWFTPILPFINDNVENFKRIINYCAKADVKGIIYFGAGLTLRDGNREYFYSKLEEHFPGLSHKYNEKYGLAYEIPSEKNRELSELFHSECERLGIMHNNEQIFSYLHNFESDFEGEQLQF